jgi:hypothetical protein
MGPVHRVHGGSRVRSTDSLNDGHRWIDLRSTFNMANHFFLNLIVSLIYIRMVERLSSSVAGTDETEARAAP